MSIARIETARLEMRPLCPADLDILHRLWTDPQVRRYLFDDEVISRQQAEQEIESSMNCFAEQGFGLWAVFQKGNSELIGFCGYKHFHDPPELQLLYGIDPAHWSKGIATEAARAMIGHGFRVDGFDRIVASADALNAASLKVMERAGLRFQKRVTLHGLNTIYYSLERGLWSEG